MSGVNVLAVLDDLIADMGDTPGTTGHQVEQARAAVAELIEAAKLMQAALQTHGDWDDGCFYYSGKSASELQTPIMGLFAALARVGGAA